MNNTYSISKTAVERFGHMFVKDRGLRLNQVRVVNAYGPRQSVAAPFGPAKVRKIIPAFTCRALTGQAIEVYGDGEQVSDMVHVQDVAKALVNALEYAEAGKVLPPETVVEVGPSEHMTVNQVAEAVRRNAASYGIPQADLVHLPMRPGEKPGDRVTARNETLKLIGLDERDMIRFADGIRLTVDWYRENWLPEYQFKDYRVRYVQ